MHGSRLTLILASVFSIMRPGSSAAPLLVFEETDWGRLAIAPLESAPYPHHTRENGYQGKSEFFPRDPHYVDSSVAFLVPRGYEPGEAVDLVVHFHGHGSILDQLIPRFQLGEQLEASGLPRRPGG